MPTILVTVTITQEDWEEVLGGGIQGIPTNQFVFRFRLLPDYQISIEGVYDIGMADGSRTTKMWSDDDEVFSDGFDVIKELARPLWDRERRTGLDPLRIFLPKLFCFDPHRSISAANLSDFDPFDSTGTKLTRHLIRWKLLGDERWDHYCNLVEEAFPGLGRLVTPQVEGTNEAYLAFRRRGTEIRISEVGTGVQQFLILSYQCIAKEAHVIALEEPEVHLHPSAQRLLFNHIRALANHAQVFLVTHSPLFVDRNDYRNNWLVSLDTKGHTQVQPLKSPDPLRAVRTALGVSLGDSLFAGDCILVVEGPTEQFVLPMLSEIARNANQPSIDFNRVALVSAGGTGNVESVIKVLKGFGVPIALLVDSDKHSRLVAKRCVEDGLVGEGSVKIIQREAGVGDESDAEFEDVLRLDLYLQALGEKYGVSVSEESFKSKEQELTEARHGHVPPRTHVCNAILVQLGKIDAKVDYDKVGVAIASVSRYGPNDVPPLLKDLADILSGMLSNEPG